MRKQSLSLFCITVLAALVFRQGACLAASQIVETFEDTNVWGTLPIPATGFTNLITSSLGWTISNGSIRVVSPPAVSLSNACTLRGDPPGGTNAVINTALITNGVGSIIYYARLGNTGVSTNRIAVDYSYGANVWVPAFTNIIASTNWVVFTNRFLSYSNQYLRLRKLSNTTTQASVLFDNIAITYPPAQLTVPAPATTPAVPTENDGISITESLTVNGMADGLFATNYWKLASSTNWIAIPMTNNLSNVFTTISTIPGQVSFTPINYYVQVIQLSDGLVYATNSVTNTLTILPRSSYSALAVTSPINAPLQLSSNYLWQGVAYVSNPVSAFRFQATSNSLTTFWGDSNQAFSNVMAYGNAELNATNIILSASNTGYHVFSFNETDNAYIVRPCVYENFEAWPTTQWTLSGGTVSNDAGGTYSGSYALLNGQQGGSTNAYLLSPLLSNGIGAISFWYRKSGSSNSLAGTLLVEIAPSPASTNWSTIATFSNLLSTTYNFVSIPWSDLNNKAIRLRNNPTGNSSQVSIDEVVVASPGAAISASSLTSTPAAPGSLDSVSLSIDLTPNAWATLTNVVVWVKGTNTPGFVAIPMTLSSGTHYIASSSIPPMLGTVYYAVQYSYSGFLAMSPQFYPFAGTNQPSSYTTTNTYINYRYEPFDSAASWGTLPWTAFTNAFTNATGWIVNNAKIISDSNAPTPSFACQLQANPAGVTNIAVTSPLLSNGLGSVVFYAKLGNVASPNGLILERSYDATTWTALRTNSITTTDWLAFTNTIVSSSNQYLRLRKKTNSSGGDAAYIDAIYCTPYPSDIIISNITRNPGYPVAGQSLNVSCTIQSTTAQFPAFNITPTLYWFAYGGPTNLIPMTSSSGTTYTTTFPLSLTNLTRDWPVTHWIICPFDGYEAIPADRVTPRYSVTNTFIVRAFGGLYSNVAANVDGSTTPGRLLSNNLWQSIVTINGATTNFSLQGLGYSTGSGYATSNAVIGNSNNWQTAVPLADTGSTGQPPFNISLSNGQYVVRYDESSGLYIVQSCAWQGFDQLSDTAGLYKRLDVNINAQNVTNNFDTWTTNEVRVRQESFGSQRWQAYTTYTNGMGGGDDGYLIFGSKISQPPGTNAYCVQTTNVTARGQAFIAQPSHWGNFPLRGVGSISYSYRASSLSPTSSIAAYFFPTYRAPDPNDSSPFQNDPWWMGPIPGSQTNVFSTNAIFRTTTVTIKTNDTFDLIFSQDSGNQNLYINNVSVTEWYADTKTNNDWIAVQSWIEPSLKPGMGQCCRFETTRSAPGTSQYLQTPILTNGIYTFSLQYCGSTANPVSFNVLLSQGDPTVFTNSIACVTNTFSGTGGDYATYSLTVLNNNTNLYLRFQNTTPAPGALLIDDIKITPYGLGDSWAINNAAVDATGMQYPPATRQFFAGACYLNSNRTANISPSSNDMPDTNTMPYVSSPALEGLGEVSFWYRNWAISGPVTPARILVQKTRADITSWTTITNIDNVINTNDYLFFQTSLYETNRSLIRICNDDTYTNAVGRICLDDILITTPMASSLTLSNLTITPAIPLNTNTVTVSVDTYRLFLLGPSNLTLSVNYGTGSNYASMAAASVSSLSMSCIATTLTPLGRSYRYATTTPIPAYDTDTFVKYEAQATFTGLHPEANSPTTFKSFATVPTWLTPLPTTGMAYYVVFSCSTGSVWINEINYGYTTTDKTNEYIELCGETSANIAGWSISMANSSANIYGIYTITNQNAFGNSTNGYGFWVIGDSNVAYRSMVFTNAESSGRNLYEPGGVRLARSCGAIVDSISYGNGTITTLTNAGYKYIGRETSSFANSSLFQTGTVGTLHWYYTTLAGNHNTPGTINELEWFPNNSQQNTPPPTVTIVAFWMNTNVWIECTSSNLWAPAPWYTSDLLGSNGWTNVTQFTSTYPTLSSSNTFTVHFPPPTNTTIFFKVVVTNAP